MESAIDHPASAAETKDTKPVVLPQDALLLEAPRLISPSGSTSSAMEMQSVHSHDGTANGEEAACCRVCLKAGAVVMCDDCKKCYHLDCHLPTLHEIPGYSLSSRFASYTTCPSLGGEGSRICLMRVAVQIFGPMITLVLGIFLDLCPLLSFLVNCKRETDSFA